VPERSSSAPIRFSLADVNRSSHWRTGSADAAQW
jgi:hypothetical protein